MRKSVLLSAVVVLVLSGCGGKQAVRTELATLLEKNRFALYTPFRTEDKPGTIFVLAPNERGKTTELPLVTRDRTFNPSVDPDELLREQDVHFAQELARTRNFSGSVAADLISMLIDAEVAAKYFSEVKITFGAPQVALAMTQEQLTAHRSEISPTTLETLRFHGSAGRLDHIYFVFETLEVANMTATATVKREFRGKVDAEKLEPAIKAGVELNHDATESFVMKFDHPMLIGYKATRIGDTIIGTGISPGEVVFEPVDPKTLHRLKR